MADRAAFLEFFDAFAGIKLESFSEVRDGRAIAAAVEILQPGTVPGDQLKQEGTGHDIENLRTIWEAMKPKISNLSEDLNFSETINDDDVLKLCIYVVALAINSPKKKDFVLSLKKLSAPSQTRFKKYIQQFYQPKSPSKPSVQQHKASTEQKVDMELEKIRATIARQQEELENIGSEVNPDKDEVFKAKNIEQMIASFVTQKKELTEAIAGKKAKEEELKRILDKLEGECAAKAKEHGRIVEARERRDKLLQQIAQCNATVVDSPDEPIDTRALNESLQQLESEEAGVSGSIAKAKEELTFLIQLETKYSLPKSESREEYNITELVQKLEELKMNLAIANDDGSVPSDLELEHKENIKLVNSLLKKRKAIDKQIELNKALRGDLQRVQEQLIAQQEDVSREVADCTVDINAANANVSDWLVLSSALTAKRDQKSYLSALYSQCL